MKYAILLSLSLLAFQSFADTCLMTGSKYTSGRGFYCYVTVWGAFTNQRRDVYVTNTCGFSWGQYGAVQQMGAPVSSGDNVAIYGPAHWFGRAAVSDSLFNPAAYGGTIIAPDADGSPQTISCQAMDMGD